MPRRRLPLPLTGSPFTTADARAQGVDRGRLRGRDVIHPHHGIHIEVGCAQDDGAMARCERLIPALGPNHWFSHRTAARIWGIPLAPAYSPHEGLHVLAVGTRVAVRHAGVIGWVTGDDLVERGMFDLLPVVSPAEAWCQLAQRGAVVSGQVIAHEWLVAAADYVLTGRRLADGTRAAPLSTVEELRAAIARRGRGRGTAALRRALDDARFPVDSPYETLTRLGLVANGLPEPQVQVAVETSIGVRHADLGYRREKLLIEYQGEEHRTSRKRWLADLTRVQLFQDAGYEVFLIGADDVVPDCSALAARVARFLRRGT
ncbi:hypothetical protein R8Z57_05680 [Microbacterium sp. M3]|uniref:DUF559 domain-containing protein n=1 Tax=Microbacterium arthrosphaerae TaxID=792652 RepID=A0ABU4GYW9_9MICO|nr:MULTISPECIES: hypothetical protein [Microbacterium]MDW4572268.1 hypothetical protein [Microbacterium arthrosphaerae]MDW7606123.1 hypothetical protein [Microbacterium sp. M3]